MKVHHVACGPAVNESEHKAFEQLKVRLSGEPGDAEWVLLTNLSFSATHHRQSDEIDVVVIGPPGVQVIEVKHWSATWINRNRELVEQEAERVTHKARKMGTTLRRHVENLPRVDGVFLVTEAASKVAALEGRENVRGIPFYTFKTWQRAVGLHAQPELSTQQIRILARALEPRSTVAVTGSLKRLAGYTRLNLLTPPDQRFHRVYEATHVSRQDSVVLHLYDLSSTADSKAAEKAEREWKSLQQLQQHNWAPRIVDSFQDAPGYPGEIKFFTVADPAAPNIEERSRDGKWETSARLIFARGAVRALANLHGSGLEGEPMVHRNLTPTTILVKHDNSPILTGFEHTRIPADVTVASHVTGKDDGPAVSPEVRVQGRGVADHRSDVYSLCVSLAILFEGRNDEAGVKTMEIFALGTDDEPKNRASLSDLDAYLSDLLGEPQFAPPPLAARYWTEDQIVSFGVNNYRIVSRLGSGGVGTTFKVVKVDRETNNDLGTYVAKVARDEHTGRRVLGAYKLAHSHLRHSALSTIFEIATEWRDNSFVALMTWVEGEPLGEYAGMLSLLAEELNESSGEALALRWLQTACHALRVLHDNGLVHGDVSPRNLIVSDSDMVLTDYDCVTRIGEQSSAPGTVLYSSPSFVQGLSATPTDDLYALAASFFHVLFDKEPFQFDGFQAKERGLNWSETERLAYPLLAEFLERATDPNPENRFASVKDALLALRSIPQLVDSPPNDAIPTDGEGIADQPKPTSQAEAGAEPLERRQNEVEWLSWLLRSYPGSRWGNSETRGLDTVFAEKTYVKTDLEQELFRVIMDRQVSLVVLCGNAGDGKTALLQRLARRLDLDVQPSATRILEGQLANGLTVRINLDGSASWNGRSADDLLDEFLAPFQDGRPIGSIVHLLAINDGRLLEWVENVEVRQDETALTKDLIDCLNNQTTTPASHIRFVNLNQRSLVGGIGDYGKTIETDFLNRLVDQLYGGESAADIWAPCRTCSAQDRCEVFRANRLFGPDAFLKESVGTRARERLFEALQAVHLRGETHITVRELRAALVYILFGVHHCSEYHSISDSSGIPAPDPYWDRAFSPGSSDRQGEVLRELLRFDPGLEAHPKIDRQLRNRASKERVSAMRLPDLEQNLASLRRCAYFEWSENDIEGLTGDPDALGLAQGRHFREFRDLVIEDGYEEKAKLIERLCGGISRLEALPLEALDRKGVVPLRVTPRTPIETAFWIEKSIDDFHLIADAPHTGNGVNQLHRQAFLIYRYRDGREETLRLGADLFHLLLELSDGYQLGDVAADDTFAHLSIFVQRLIREDHRSMLAWNPVHENSIFEISAQIVDEYTDRQQRLMISPIKPSDKINDK